jgi:hypothetical protein
MDEARPQKVLDLSRLGYTSDFGKSAIADWGSGFVASFSPITGAGTISPGALRLLEAWAKPPAAPPAPARSAPVHRPYKGSKAAKRASRGPRRGSR